MKELTEDQIVQNKEEFIKIFKELINREGSVELLKWLINSDFFVAPASTKYHSCCKGGLCAHSLYVYKRLKQHMEQETKISATNETVAICGLLHDICKINYFSQFLRNVKENGTWIQVEEYKADEVFPFGHGEKSVFLINEFMHLTREEAMAINWHMGWSDVRFKGGSSSFDNAYKKFPFAVLLFVSDVEATFIDENSSL